MVILALTRINYHTCQEHQQPKVDMYVYGGWPSKQMSDGLGMYGDDDYISSRSSFDVSSPALNNYHTRDLLNVTIHSEVTGGAQYEEESLSRTGGAFRTNDVKEISPYYYTGSSHLTSEAISSIF